MKRKTAYLIINPRLGKNVARLADILALFSAAAWKTDIALKEFGGHTMQLAREAAEDDYDLVIGYGGDGTLNQVVNGVMTAKRRRSVVGLMPGGTANVWAHEIGLPEDPVKAALLLINSEGRKVDLGHIKADSVDLPRHHFLLMAGLGIDAAVMRRVSTSLKERIGEAAVALAAVKELPSQHSFPIEIRSSGAARGDGVLWKGEALQVIVGNTRRYGNVAEATPEAHIDDGMLDVIITAGAPLATLAQILSTLLQREPVQGRSEYFQGVHFWIGVPASVHLHLDGSRVKLENSSATRMTYRFDAMPRALRVAIPYTYNEELFDDASGDGSSVAAEPRGPIRTPFAGRPGIRDKRTAQATKRSTRCSSMDEGLPSLRSARIRTGKEPGSSPVRYPTRKRANPAPWPCASTGTRPCSTLRESPSRPPSRPSFPRGARSSWTGRRASARSSGRSASWF